jgi:hypothetical protein
MSKYERIIKMPAVVLDAEAAEKVAGMFHELAEARVTVVLRERMVQANVQAQHLVPAVFAQNLAPQAPDAALIEQYVENESYRDLIRPTFGDKYTFLSPHGNMQFLYNDVEYKDIPPDPLNVIVESAGPGGEILNLNLKANTQVNDFLDHSINRILVQGSDSAWVNDTYEKLRVLTQSSKEPIRNLVYHWIPFFIWLTFFFCTVIEYKVARLASTFRWNVPLNGLQLLAIFVLFAVTLIGSANLFTRILPFLYPYFELEGKFSRRRKTWRKPVVIEITLLYGAAITMLFAVK